MGGLLAGLVAVLGAAIAATSDIPLVGPGSAAPDFEAVNIATGDPATLADYRGDVVLLNIWATWCRACEEEMPSMQRLHEQLAPSGLRIVAVSIDKASSQEVLRWVQERDLTFDVLHDRQGRIENLYQTTGVPESFVIDRHGALVKKEIGAREWDVPAQVAYFRRLLGLEGGVPAADAPQCGLCEESAVTAGGVDTVPAGSP